MIQIKNINCAKFKKPNVHQVGNFLKHTIKNYRETGAIAASSRKLAKLFVKTGDIKNQKVVVEFGSGTGVFTEEILKAIPKDCIYFAIEINEEFVKATRERCPDATVYHDSAQQVGKYLKSHGVESCDVIISGLPFANFDDALQNDIIQSAVDALKPGGVFLTFAYTVGLLTSKGKKFKAKLPEYFAKVKKTKTVINNLPPAFIYHAIKG